MNWNMLFIFCQKNDIKLELEHNGIIYDKNFKYNKQKDIITADSSQNPKEQFGADGKTVIHYIGTNSIKITLHI